MIQPMAAPPFTPPPQWRSVDMNVPQLVDNINRGIYNVNPEHQRNVVHDTVWKAEIIESIFQTGCLPATFWHRSTTPGAQYDSVDGKQRCTAICEYLNDQFKWRSRLYSELHETLRFHIDTFPVTTVLADRTLTDAELTRTFQKFQITKATTLGEIWNAHLCPLRDKINAFLAEDDDLLFKHDVFQMPASGPKCPRYQHLELYGKAFAHYHAGRFVDRQTVERIWLRHCDEAANEWGCFRKHLKTTLRLLTTNSSLTRKKSHFIPLFCLVHQLTDERRAEGELRLASGLIELVGQWDKHNNPGMNYSTPQVWDRRFRNAQRIIGPQYWLSPK